jgi:soluble lytic murein transglycosylase
VPYLQHCFQREAIVNLLRPLLLCVLIIGSTETAWAQSDNAVLLPKALLAVEQKDFEAANDIAAQSESATVQTLVTWSQLRAGEGTWDAYESFLSKHPDWPGLKRLRKQAENTIPENAASAEVLSFFAGGPPQTGTGALRLITAQSDKETAQKLIISAWTEMSLSENEQQSFMDAYSAILKPHHTARIENLLWRKLRTQAERMKPLVTADIFKLAQARMAIQRRDDSVDSAIKSVPSALLDDAGLAFDRFEWRMAKDRWDEAQQLITDVTSPTSKMGRPDKWASRRRGFARRAMRAGQIDQAYKLASKHGLTSGSSFADLEWLSGYISLTYAKNPQQALKHFKTFNASVKSPISLGRAAYWLGRVYEALEQYDRATTHYIRGANYQTGFYGQLSAERIQASPDDALAGNERVGDWRKSSFANSSVFEAAVLLHQANKPVMTRWFMTHMAETLSRDEILQLADYANQMGSDFVTLGIAKEAAKRGIILPKPYFPVTKLAAFSKSVPAEVAMSIARRESELKPDAISPAGARGLMQIMPATAKDVAKKIDVAYAKDRLTQDWEYNATLGTAYLGDLIQKYDGSYVLAFAAYNAGPHRVTEWIELYGDPRDPLTSVVDWIEHIPFRETRNYVMRVMESLHVYRARISGKTPPLQLISDLSRG